MNKEEDREGLKRKRNASAGNNGDPPLKVTKKFKFLWTFFLGILKMNLLYFHQQIFEYFRDFQCRVPIIPEGPHYSRHWNVTRGRDRIGLCVYLCLSTVISVSFYVYCAYISACVSTCVSVRAIVDTCMSSIRCDGNIQYGVIKNKTHTNL